MKLLASLLKASTATVAYTGAGISTASGVPDYASKASGSVAPHMAGGSNVPKKSMGAGSRLEASPTYSHHALAALHKKKLVHHWLQQNHDRLAQKAGFPQESLNEIHGAWGDKKNSVLMMDDKLRPDLLCWLESWREKASLCIAMGTSLCGMTSDCVAEACAKRFMEGTSAMTHAHTTTTDHPGSDELKNGNEMQSKMQHATRNRKEHGLVIINLQATKIDKTASLRIWGLLDTVFQALAKELGLKLPLTSVSCQGQEWVRTHPNCKYATPTRKKDDLL